jgi:hypothetical protein
LVGGAKQVCASWPTVDNCVCSSGLTDGNLYSKGIIDPTKVVRSLQDAASIAGLLITTEALVAERPKKKTPPAAGADAGAGIGDMDY